jgi:hypothetical protein
MSLISQSSFTGSGSLKDLAGEELNESRSILETFNTFHQSWFPAVDYIRSVAIGECYANDTNKIVDYGEPRSSRHAPYSTRPFLIRTWLLLPHH